MWLYILNTVIFTIFHSIYLLKYFYKYYNLFIIYLLVVKTFWTFFYSIFEIELSSFYKFLSIFCPLYNFSYAHNSDEHSNHADKCNTNSVTNLFQFYSPNQRILFPPPPPPPPKHLEATGGHMERGGRIGWVANKQLLSYLLFNIFTHNFNQLT